MLKRYQVFVSSTFEDLKEARQKVIESLLKLRCLPAVMEFFVASDHDRWSLNQRVLDESDYYVVIVAAKYGSTITDGQDAGMSYTEKDYRYARKKGILSVLMCGAWHGGHGCGLFIPWRCERRNRGYYWGGCAPGASQLV